MAFVVIYTPYKIIVSNMNDLGQKMKHDFALWDVDKLLACVTLIHDSKVIMAI